LQYAGPILALVHPTGQPLYVLLGKVWSELVPVGTVAYRMNLLAAVSTALGGAAMTWLLFRMSGRVWIGLVSGLVLGLGATIWGEALLADKYGFTVLLAAIISGLALWWAQTPPGSDSDDRLLYALSLAFGIGLLHHRSLALFAPGIAVMVIFRLRTALWRRWRHTAICAALVFVPALIAYPTVLPLLRANDNSPLMWQPVSARDWVDFLLERHVLSGEALVFDSAASIGRQLEIYAETLLRDYTPLVPLVALVGLVWLLRRIPPGGAFLGISFVLLAFLSANFRGNERQFTYYLPSFVALIYGFGFGLYGLTRIAAAQLDRLPPPQRLALGGVGALLFFAVPVAQFASTFPQQHIESRYGDSLDLWRQTLKSGDMGARLVSGMDRLPERAAVAADWEQVTILWYEQQVENRRPDLTIFYPIERYAEYLDTQPVCLARHLPVGESWHLTNVDAFVCLNAAPTRALPADVEQLNIPLYTPDGAAVIELAGFRVNAAPIYAPGEHAQLMLVWRALAEMDADYSVSLQVLTEDWQPVWQRDIQNPVMGLYPTSRWAQDEIVEDYHEISVPQDLTPGRYLWTVVLYEATADGQFVTLRDDQGNTNILGGVFTVE
ncbi:MAG: protein O-mannosyl-transferase family, partial [Chloroflexota bacterium]